MIILTWPAKDKQLFNNYKFQNPRLVESEPRSTHLHAENSHRNALSPDSAPVYSFRLPP